MLTSQDDIFAIMQAKSPDGMPIQLPPRVFVEMGGHFVSYDPDAHILVAQFPNLDRFHNPIGHMQGGIIITLIDNTIGPLSYLAAPLSATTELNTSFIRPVTPQDETVTVRGWLVEQTRTQVFLGAEMLNAQGKRVALASATCRVLEI